jgi:hypothetical protein
MAKYEENLMRLAKEVIPRFIDRHYFITSCYKKLEVKMTYEDFNMIYNHWKFVERRNDNNFKRI